ncbi:MAG: MoaD/ThiS family protein [Candidatus Jordarchaeum sp.]|uniref:MoaD/ThiS family protein n=1 Tax=Candidatus Jordarchaeum sp. TaxID=2823881 RepID=UPI00404969D1
MRLKIRYLSIIRSDLGIKREEIEIPEKTSLLDVFGILTERHGEKFSKFLYDPINQTIKRGALVIINGEIVRRSNMDSKIPEDAELVIGVMAAGG